MDERSPSVRRVLLAHTICYPQNQLELEVEFGTVWDVRTFRREFEVIKWEAPFVDVRRRDGVLGSLIFQHEPRYYYCWKPEE